MYGELLLKHNKALSPFCDWSKVWQAPVRKLNGNWPSNFKEQSPTLSNWRVYSNIPPKSIIEPRNISEHEQYVLISSSFSKSWRIRFSKYSWKSNFSKSYEWIQNSDILLLSYVLFYLHLSLINNYHVFVAQSLHSSRI